MKRIGLINFCCILKILNKNDIIKIPESGYIIINESGDTIFELEFKDKTCKIINRINNSRTKEF